MIFVDDVTEAHDFARKQRMALAKLVEIDVTVGGDPEACVRFRKAAMSGDAERYEYMLTQTKASALMAAGAIKFRRAP